MTSSHKARSSCDLQKGLVLFLRPSGRNLGWWIIASLAMCVVGVLSAATPCHNDLLPPELCVPEARSDFGMVATGSLEATEVAVEILENGGNAIDAAVAAAFMLGVVEFQSSGLGGLTNVVVHLANGRTIAIGGISHTPMAIDIERFREFKTRDRNFGYETIAVPTTLAVLEYVRGKYGTIDLATLLEPAIEIAETGFPLKRIQIIKIKKYYDDIVKSSPYMRSLVLEDGRTIGNVGDRRRLPDLANTYRRIATEGVQSFYTGSIADEIEADMIQGGSFLRKADLNRVSVREIQPLRTNYRGYGIYTFPPPGGGAVVVSILNLLETFPSDFLAESSAERHQVFLDTFRIAAADAQRAIARQRISGMNPLSKQHARNRAKIIVPGEKVPEGLFSTSSDPECAQPGQNTTHLSVADGRGNVVSLTQTLSRSFGAKVATRGLGFPYNNFLAEYSADDSRCPDYLRPNTPILTPMSPTIVLKDGKLFAALGSPGSEKIPPLVSEVISNMVDRNMGVRDAVAAPRVLWGGGPSAAAWIEVIDPITKSDVRALKRMGFAGINTLRYPPRGKTKMNDFGGVNAVAYDLETGGFTGVGDPRLFGSAMGPRLVTPRE